MKKLIAYIDGFNLYHRAVKGTPYKWLDFESLIRKLIPEEYKILKIRYFTAMVKDRKGRNKQHTYLRATQTNPKIEIHKGLFLLRNKSFTEKCSDVSLGTYMIRDACKEDYDCSLLVSNDLDFRDPLNLLKEEFNKDIIILNPDKGNAIAEYRNLAKINKIKLRDIRGATLKNSQLPDPVILSNGKEIRKPDQW